MAHLARTPRAFALEHGSDDLPLRFKLWFGKAFDLARDIASFAASTIASKKHKLEQQLADILGAATQCDLAHQLQAKIGRARDQLLTFCDYPGEVEATNNCSERELAALRDPAKSHQRLPRHVGRPSRGGRPNRPSTPQGSRAQTPSRQFSAHSRDEAAEKPRPKNRGG